jgi:hypothetical protein
MKPRSMFVMMAAMAASLKSFFTGKKEFSSNKTQPPEKRTGKSKGGRKAVGLINGLPRKSAKGTALGNWLKFDAFTGKYHPISDTRPENENRYSKKAFIAA